MGQHLGLNVTMKASAGKSPVPFVPPYLLQLGHQLLERLHCQHLLE